MSRWSQHTVEPSPFIIHLSIRATYNEPSSKSVVFDIMLKLVEAMRQKNIPFSFLVGDLPTYKTILQLKAENLERFMDIIPILGGKHYRRGLCCILLWREALIQNHLSQVLQYEDLPATVQHNLGILRNALTATQATLQESNCCLEDKVFIRNLITKVYEKPGTDMGDFWVSFLEMSDPLVQCLDAFHARNVTEYLSSTYNMLPGLMAYNNHDYGRWLPDYWAMLPTLPDEQMTFISNHFAQSMTGLPYSCQPLDLLKTTMNLNLKLKQRWMQLLHNKKQLFATTRDANTITRVKATVQQNLKCQRHHRKHVECQPARMKKDEQAVQDLLATMQDFDADPFDISSPTLRSLQSGLVTSSRLVHDFKTALADGEVQVETLLQERVFTKTKPLTATIHKNKRQTFASEQILAPPGAVLKVSQMERQELTALVDLAEKTGVLTLERALEGRVTEECLSMYNVDGSMWKTVNS